MATLKDFSLYPISWNLTPEDAVTLYLEWGNNDWNAEYPPVRSKDDVAYYFVVDSWKEPPQIRLVKRNSENAEDIFSMPVPEDLLPGFKAVNGNLKGISAPTPEIKSWLKQQLGQQDINT